MQTDAYALHKFSLYVTLALLAALPGIAMRLGGLHAPPVIAACAFGAAILGAGFLLSWGAEAAEEHMSQGLAIAVLALVTILPEYAVDVYFTLQAGRHPGSDYVQFAAANMTGANRLLIGVAWPLVVLLTWWKSGKRAITLRPDNAVEVVFLTLATLYSFVITLRGSITLFDMVILIGIYGAYLWRVSKLPKNEEDEDEEESEVGPAAALETLPKARQWAIMAALTLVAALIILAVAQPFAESLLAAGQALGVNKFVLIQWMAPLAGEAPEVVLTVLFVLNLRPTAALGALISDKINQWTLLVGMIPLFYSLAAGRTLAFPLSARQHEEFFLTAAQSLFAVALLLRLRLSLPSALVLLTLFGVQLGVDFVYRHNEPKAIQFLAAMAWLYLAFALLLFAWSFRSLLRFGKMGLFPGDAETQEERTDREIGEESNG